MSSWAYALVRVVGITVVTGDAWLTEEVAHTLRMLEIIGRTDIPVGLGAGGREAYAKFLAADTPKAFAIGPNGAWTWRASMADAMQAALERCAEHDRGSFLGKEAGGGFAESAARASDNDHFPCDIVAHDI